MNKNCRPDPVARLTIGGLCSLCLVFGLAAFVWHKPASANVYAQQATGYQCAECHVDVSKDVTRKGLTSFGTQWQDAKCPTKSGNLCVPK